MTGESGLNGSIIDELHFRDIEGDQMAGEGGVTRSIIEELFLGYPTRLHGR